MNCPSRTEQTPLHPEWNQNPPFLPADLTTRQDLNGIVNSRQYRDDDDSATSDSSQTKQRHVDSDPDVSPGIAARSRFADAKLPLHNRDEVCAAKPRVPNLTRNLTSALPRVDSFLSRSRPWIWSGAILLFISVAFYFLRWAGLCRGLLDLWPQSGSMANSDRPLPDHVGESLVAVGSLAKRASTCGSSSGAAGQEYDIPLHAGAIVIILFVSFTACAFPLLAVRFPGLHIPPSFLFVVRHFGTGVLIATAFVHLLPTAFISLGDPCLSEFWTSDYPAMPGAISLAAVFLVTLVEMIFSPGRPVCGNTADITRAMSAHPVRRVLPAESTDTVELSSSDNEDANRRKEKGPDTTNNEAQTETLYRHPSRRHDPLCGRSTSIGRGLARLNGRGGNRDQPREMERMLDGDSVENASDAVVLTPEQQHKKAVLQCLMLEMGILFHSIFIGMALSVSIGKEFIILLIAITFHQLFEGLALGSRIAVLSWEPGAVQPWIMALAYGCTTPLGQAIGLATHTLYSPGSEVGLTMVGVMNAISAGLLVYASLVELLSEDFLSDESWRHLRGKRRVGACALVFFGAAGMSLIGAWA